ncbi:AbrB/MazE/SpoVT family DNA-binding domain-containing protein [Candidatus Bathyarchaeota archaeon]|nr:AbrB/MazE/SpoVT family DNA-binding domain-containing protein [Candidatus Bathyarchaeota archaeon]
MTQIVSITSKGQATIPKDLRDKYGLRDKAIVEATPEGILFKPLPQPSEERGSLRHLLGPKTAQELLSESRELDETRDRRLRGETP